jgi:hypothetical protein
LWFVSRAQAENLFCEEALTNPAYEPVEVPNEMADTDHFSEAEDDDGIDVTPQEGEEWSHDQWVTEAEQRVAQPRRKGSKAPKGKRRNGPASPTSVQPWTGWEDGLEEERHEGGELMNMRDSRRSRSRKSGLSEQDEG